MNNESEHAGGKAYHILWQEDGARDGIDAFEEERERVRGAEEEADGRRGVSLLWPVLAFFLGDRKLTAFRVALFTALTVVETISLAFEPVEPVEDATRGRFALRMSEPVPMVVRELGFAGSHRDS